MIHKLRRFLISENWNIGFVDNFSAADLIRDKKLPKINWMRHSYKDRAFADPFILDANEDEITVLCEELVFGQKGIISKLIVSRKDFRLLNRIELLSLETHLSYPAIINYEDKIYIYPENSEASNIKLYEYDKFSDLLNIVRVIADDELTDFTICQENNGEKYFALSTKLHPDSEENAYMYVSKDILGPFQQVGDKPVVRSRLCSRPGGDFFNVDDITYRPAQNCVDHYGSGLKIMKVNSFEPFNEKELFELKPSSFKYHRGIHTLNFKDNMAVIDGYGYLYPLIGRLICPLNRIRIRLKGM